MMLILGVSNSIAQSLPDSMAIDSKQIAKKPLLQQLDSISKSQFPQEKYAVKIDSVTAKLDSLATLPAKHLDKWQSKADSTYRKLENKLTSTTSHITRKSDSLQNNLLSKGKGITNLVEEKRNGINKIDKLQKSLTEKLDKVNGQRKLPINIGKSKKLEGISQNTKGLTAGLLNTTSLKEKMPIGLGGKLPKVNVNEKIKGLTTKVTEVDKLNGLSSKTAELSNFPKTQILSRSESLLEDAELLKKSQNIGEFSNELNVTRSFNRVKNEASKYKEDLSAISNGNIEEVKQAPEYVENKLKNVAGVSAVEDHQAAMDARVADFTQPSKDSDLNKLDDKDYLKGQATPIANQAIQQLQKNIDHFAKHTDKIKAAQGKLAKLKRKYSSLESMKNPPKKKPNPLKGKTLGERLTIGGNFQLYKTQPFGVDVSPQLAYQLTKKFSMGVGGTYRTGFNKKKDFLFTKEKEAYGFRAYSEHGVYKSFYAHGEFERLHEQANKITATDLLATQWNSKALLGIGKTYNFTKGIKGNVMVLYNFLNDKTDPYRRPWNIRFGFELKGSKKDKKDNPMPRLRWVRND